MLLVPPNLLILSHKCRNIFVVSLLAACYIQQQPACMKRSRCFNRATKAAELLCFGQRYTIPRSLQHLPEPLRLHSVSDREVIANALHHPTWKTVLQHLEFSIKPAQTVMLSLSVLVCAIMFPALNVYGRCYVRNFCYCWHPIERPGPTTCRPPYLVCGSQLESTHIPWWSKYFETAAL